MKIGPDRHGLHRISTGDRVGPYARADWTVNGWFCSSLLVESARDLARVMNVNSRATAMTMCINYIKT